MPGPASPAALAELVSAVGSSRAAEAVEAAIEALTSGTPPVEVLRAAALGSAPRYDLATGAPHGLIALAAAANARGFMDEKSQALAALQAVHLAAASPKQSEPLRPAPIVSGEVAHLGRSALLATRGGDLSEAESLFLGIVEEGWERRMAGDMLFRAALEDCGDGGHKLLASLKTWQLCQALGFRDARTILRPAIQYLVKGEKDSKSYDTMMGVLGKEWVDLEGLVLGSRSLDEAGTAEVGTVLAASSEEACITGVLHLLRAGYAPAALAGGIVIEAGKRLLAPEDHPLATAHAFLYAHAAHHVLNFSRTSERLYALFQSALRIRSPAPGLFPLPHVAPKDEGEGLATLAEDLKNCRAREAISCVRTYLANGHSSKRLFEVLGHEACLGSAVADQGHALSLVDACASEFSTTRGPEIAMALANVMATSPGDVAAGKAWAARLAP
ncbi:MAG TPA: hypothetical protein VIB49_07830 [Thermoplasmata archaeon]